MLSLILIWYVAGPNLGINATGGECARQGSRRDREIKRREVELDPQVSPEEIMSREVELGCESWTSFASSCCSTAVQRTLSL